MSHYLHTIMASFTWRRVAFTQLLGQIFAEIVALDGGFSGDSFDHPSSHFVAISAFVFLLVPVALCGDEAVTRGARPILVNTLVLLLVSPCLALAVVAATQWAYCSLLAIPWPSARWDFARTSLAFTVPCSFALLMYINRRAADRMLEGLRRAELTRVRLDQQLIESRLATAEAQIDPQMLFAALAQIKRGLEDSQPQAEHDLNELIQKLRAALARTTAISPEVSSL